MARHYATIIPGALPEALRTAGVTAEDLAAATSRDPSIISRLVTGKRTRCLVEVAKDIVWELDLPRSRLFAMPNATLRERPETYPATEGEGSGGPL